MRSTADKAWGTSENSDNRVYKGQKLHVHTFCKKMNTFSTINSEIMMKSYYTISQLLFYTSSSGFLKQTSMREKWIILFYKFLTRRVRCKSSQRLERLILRETLSIFRGIFFNGRVELLHATVITSFAPHSNEVLAYFQHIAPATRSKLFHYVLKIQFNCYCAYQCFINIFAQTTWTVRFFRHSKIGKRD